MELDGELQVEWEKVDKGKRKQLCHAFAKKRAKVAKASPSAADHPSGDQVAAIAKSLVETLSTFLQKQPKRLG
eukprot:10296932-Prorocentrum_lima.AAC.1